MSDLSKVPKPEGDSEVHMGHIIYLDKRFDNLDASFSDLLTRFQNLETHVDNRFNQIESKLDSVIRYLNGDQSSEDDK